MADVPKSMQRVILVVGGVFILALLVVAVVSPTKPSSSNRVSATPTPDICATSETALNQRAKSISFKQLDKNADSFAGQIAKFTGQVIQVSENSSGGFIRLAVTRASYGWSAADIVYVNYNGHTSALQDDVVSITGPITGAYTYTSQANYQITIPGMRGCYIHVIK